MKSLIIINARTPFYFQHVLCYLILLHFILFVTFGCFISLFSCIIVNIWFYFTALLKWFCSGLNHVKLFVTLFWRVYYSNYFFLICFFSWSDWLLVILWFFCCNPSIYSLFLGSSINLFGKRCKLSSLYMLGIYLYLIIDLSISSTFLNFLKGRWSYRSLYSIAAVFHPVFYRCRLQSSGGSSPLWRFEAVMDTYSTSWWPGKKQKHKQA